MRQCWQELGRRSFGRPGCQDGSGGQLCLRTTDISEESREPLPNCAARLGCASDVRNFLGWVSHVSAVVAAVHIRVVVGRNFCLVCTSLAEGFYGRVHIPVVLNDCVSHH